LILLDTHAWVWWTAEPARLSAAAISAIEAARRSGEVLVSAISVWEVSLLVSRQRLRLTMEVEDWIAHSEALPSLRFVPVDHHIARRSVFLPPPLHPDPADRIIAATAIARGVPLVSRDRRLRDYAPLETIW
jgi:PIN domain nuclease of toxin-antitoxin system